MGGHHAGLSQIHPGGLSLAVHQAVRVKELIDGVEVSFTIGASASDRPTSTQIPQFSSSEGMGEDASSRLEEDPSPPERG